MIRPITFLCLISAFGSGLYLYSEKHKAVLLDRDIARAIHGTEAARERTGLLRAEWALLNDPGRLQDMADKYLALKPMAPGQFVQLADLSSRLPPAASQPPSGGTDDPAADDAPAIEAAAPDASASVASATDANGQAGPQATTGGALIASAIPLPGSAAAADAPAMIVKAAPPAAPPHTQAARIARATPKKTPRPTSLARNDAQARETLPHDGPLARGTMLPLAGLPQGGARVVSAMARPARPMPRPAVVTAGASALGTSAYIGSALAGGGGLPPPVPLR